MKEDISIPFLKYRDCCRTVWNNYFINLDIHDETGWETHEYFQEVAQKLFNAMIAGKLYQRELEQNESGYYDEITIRPNLGPFGFGAMWAKPEGPNYEWQAVQLKTETNEFRFMEFFDWTTERTMDNQYVRVRLIASDELQELVGSDFLLEAWNVKYLKKEE